MANEQPPREPPHLSVVSFDAARPPPDTIYANELAKPLGPVPWICASLRIAPGRPTVVFGADGVRKSFFVQGLALACASGSQLLGFDVRACRVLHLDYEQTRRPTADRYQLLARGMGIDLESLGTKLAYRWAPLSWRGHAALDTLLWHVDGFDLVIIDALRGTLDGVDENSVAASAPLDLATHASERTGACFVFIDHTGKPGDVARKPTLRGHQSKRDATQVLIALSTASKTGPTRVVCERDQISGSFFQDFFLTVQEDADALRIVRPSPVLGAVPTAVPEHDSEPVVLEPVEKVRAAIVRVLAEHPNITSANKLVRLAHCSKKPLLDELRNMKTAGLVSFEGGRIRLTQGVQS